MNCRLGVLPRVSRLTFIGWHQRCPCWTKEKIVTTEKHTATKGGAGMYTQRLWHQQAYTWPLSQEWTPFGEHFIFPAPMCRVSPPHPKWKPYRVSVCQNPGQWINAREAARFPEALLGNREAYLQIMRAKSQLPLVVCSVCGWHACVCVCADV